MERRGVSEYPWLKKHRLLARLDIILYCWPQRRKYVPFSYGSNRMRDDRIPDRYSSILLSRIVPKV